MRTTHATAVLLVAGVLAGCGGAGGDGKRAPATSRAEPGAASVIRSWADTLRRGDVRGAASFFALPSVVSNGTPPIVLHSPADARLFNVSLPCGARLLRTSTSGRYTTATFRLTERPGAGSCGSGTGLTASTRFVIRGGKIREWRRVADRPPPAVPVV